MIENKQNNAKTLGLWYDNMVLDKISTTEYSDLKSVQPDLKSELLEKRQQLEQIPVKDFSGQQDEEKQETQIKNTAPWKAGTSHRANTAGAAITHRLMVAHPLAEGKRKFI